jgi:hypothetical protein
MRKKFFWALAPLNRVMSNLATTRYPSDHIEYVVGDVCQTLPARHESPIAILRLDTDWYASTRCELECLYPQLQPGGILIVDDYGHWDGSRRACDEYLARCGGSFTLYRATIQAIFWSRAPTLYQWNFRNACVLGEDYSPGRLFR